MNQLDLLPRKKAQLAPNAWFVPNWLPLDRQNDLLACLREWCKGGWRRPQMPDGTPMNHPLCGLGLNWQPYQYSECDRPFPIQLHFMAARALEETLSAYLPFFPDVAIINYFPPESSLGMHQDRSEDESLREAGSPIITLSLGDSCTFRLGNCQNKNQPYQDIELRSGDLIVMGGHSRMAYHGVLKIHPGTAPADLDMKQPGRISITIRQAKAEVSHV